VKPFEINLLVEALSLLTALGFGLNAILVRKGLKDSNPATATLVISMVQVTVLSILLVMDPPKINWVALAYFAASGVMASTLGRTLNYLSINKLGVAISTSLVGANPLFSTLFAFLFLSEKVAVTTILGSILVVVGIAVISSRGEETSYLKRDLLIPLGAACFYAASSTFRKIGLNILPESVLGAVVGASMSLIIYPMYLAASQRLGDFKLARSSLPYLVVGGVVVSLTWIAMFYAFKLGSVSVVSSLMGTSPLFSLVLSAILLKETEKITKKVVIGSIVIVAGIVTISLF
jgi:drug/metabolite transporter (DMT)-like permease